MTILTAALCGFLLDLLLGDPDWMPHPVVLMGKGISFWEKLFRPEFPKTPKGEFWAGFCLVLSLCLDALLSALLLLWREKSTLGSNSDSWSSGAGRSWL